MIPPGAHALSKERSTVGSASATASVADESGSAYTYDDKDKMSESQDQEQENEQDMDEMEAGTTSSMGGMSDGNASLVGWGEGAESTVSGPVSSVAASQGSKMPTPVPQGSGGGSVLGSAAQGQSVSAGNEDVKMG